MRKSPFFDELFAILAVVAFFSQSINAAGVSYGRKFTSENNSNNMLDIDTHSDLSEHPKHRLTRSITNSSDKFETIERNIEKMNERISRVKNSPSFNADDSSTVEGLQIIVDHLKEDLKTLKKQPELKADAGLLNEKLENLTRSFGVVQAQLIKLQTKEENEAKKQLPDDVVRHLQSHEFALAEEALKKGNNGTYIYAVKKVYDHHAANFDLLIRFGDFVREVDEKWKIYDALYYEIVSSGHNDTQKLARLSQSIKREIIDRSNGPTAVAAQSLYNALWSVVQEDVVNQITASLLNDQPNIILLSNEANFQQLVGVFEKVIREVWGKLSTAEVLDRAQNHVKTINAQIALQVAQFRELEIQNHLFHTQNAVPLARHIKLTMDAVNYNNSTSSEARSQHELLKNKLPESLKNIVFSSAVCVKNVAYKEYLFAKSDQYDDKRREVFTWIPGTINEPSKFKWTVEFISDFQIRLRNYNSEDYLYGECGSEFNHYDEHRDYVFAKKLMPENVYYGDGYTWNLEVDEDGMRFKNIRGNEYILADRVIKNYDGKIRSVFTNRHKHRPDDSKWQIIDCSEK